MGSQSVENSLFVSNVAIDSLAVGGLSSIGDDPTTTVRFFDGKVWHVPH
jgi:hypothetical protein